MDGFSVVIHRICGDPEDGLRKRIWRSAIARNVIEVSGIHTGAGGNDLLGNRERMPGIQRSCDNSMNRGDTEAEFTNRLMGIGAAAVRREISDTIRVVASNKVVMVHGGENNEPCRIHQQTEYCNFCKNGAE